MKDVARGYDDGPEGLLLRYSMVLRVRLRPKRCYVVARLALNVVAVAVRRAMEAWGLSAGIAVHPAR